MFCWIRIRNTNSGSGSSQKFRIHADPDPQHCCREYHMFSLYERKDLLLNILFRHQLIYEIKNLLYIIIVKIKKDNILFWLQKNTGTRQEVG